MLAFQYILWLLPLLITIEGAKSRLDPRDAGRRFTPRLDDHALARRVDDYPLVRVNDRSLASRDDTAPLRDVYIGIAVDLTYVGNRDQLPNLDPQAYADVATHPLIEIVGDGQINGNLRTEISIFGTLGHGAACLVNDYGLNNPMNAPVSRFVGNSQYVRSIKIGSLRINNKDLFDATTGKGIIQDVWSRNPDYKIASHNCIDYINDLVNELKLTPPPDFGLFYQQHREAAEKLLADPRRAVSDYGKDNCPVVTHQRTVASDPKKLESWVWDIKDFNAPNLIQHEQPEVLDAGNPSEFGAGNELRSPDGQKTISNTGELAAEFPDDPPADVRTFVDEADNPDIELQRLVDGIESSAISENDPLVGSSGGSTSRGIVSVDGPAELAVVRSRGVLYTVASVAKQSLEGVGLGATVATAITTPIFVILDLINGNWVGAAFSAAAGIVGLATTIFFSNPIGVLIGAALEIFFSIFPGLFNAKPSPTTTNPAQIIQWSFFGDASHTGNEGCNAQRAKAHLDQNCTALYGAGTISKIYNWNIFDCIVFLLDKNGGQPMSIVDMSNFFPVKDYTVPNWSANRSTYVDCGEAPKPQPLPGYAGEKIPGYHVDMTPASGYSCSKPKYYLNRTLINLPALNATADKIYPRIIPAPGGDCKLFSDPVNGVKLPLFDLTITGRPVGIECGLYDNATVGVDASTNLYSVNPNSNANSSTYSPGTVLVYSPLTNTSTNYTLPSYQNSTSNNLTSISGNGSGTSNANSSNPASLPPTLPTEHTVSTDNSTTRAYRSAPAPVPFAAYNSTNALCFTQGSSSLCLPNGTYDTSDGGLGFTSRTCTGLQMPSGANLSFSYPSELDQAATGNPYAASAGDQLYKTPAVYASNVTADNSKLAKTFKSQFTNLAISDKTFSVYVPNLLPGVCLFTQKQYKGNVQCFGLGGANVTGAITTQAQSLSVKGNANLWMYSGKYGDLTGVFANTDVPDLTAVPDGTQLNFANRVKAMWISLPS